MNKQARAHPIDDGLDHFINMAVATNKIGPKTRATLERCDRLVAEWRARKAAQASAKAVFSA